MRLFAAIRFTDRINLLLRGAIEDIRRQSRRAGCTDPDNLHLTLAFIGETDNMDCAVRALERLSSDRFPLVISGSGRFFDLYWAGVEASFELTNLASSVQRLLREEGFAIERRAFKPHITLARRVVSDRPLRLNIRRAEMTVGKVSLMKSERIGGKLTYTEIFSKPLG